MDTVLSSDRVMREAEVLRVSGYSTLQIRRLEKAGKFPRRFKLNPDAGPRGAIGWDYGEVMAWLERRRASREPAIA
jgi:prophage regulatory protein